jgi:hypothetical protein
MGVTRQSLHVDAKGVTGGPCRCVRTVRIKARASLVSVVQVSPSYWRHTLVAFPSSTGLMHLSVYLLLLPSAPTLRSLSLSLPPIHSAMQPCSHNLRHAANSHPDEMLPSIHLHPHRPAHTEHQPHQSLYPLSPSLFSTFPLSCPHVGQVRPRSLSLATIVVTAILPLRRFRPLAIPASIPLGNTRMIPLALATTAVNLVVALPSSSASGSGAKDNAKDNENTVKTPKSFAKGTRRDLDKERSEGIAIWEGTSVFTRSEPSGST